MFEVVLLWLAHHSRGQSRDKVVDKVEKVVDIAVS
jgi:hypothetical protein